MAILRWMTVCVGGVIVLMSASGAWAQKHDKTFNDWNTFTMTQGGKKVCYIASYPKKQEGNYNSRGEPYVLVTSRGANDEVSTSSGYPYKKDSEVTVNIDGKVYKLFTKGELAWAPDAKSDAQLVEAMKKGRKMTVRGTSQLDTYSEDSYSLSGVTAAYRRMKSLCK